MKKITNIYHESILIELVTREISHVNRRRKVILENMNPGSSIDIPDDYDVPQLELLKRKNRVTVESIQEVTKSEVTEPVSIDTSTSKSTESVKSSDDVELEELESQLSSDEPLKSFNDKPEKKSSKKKSKDYL